MEKNDIEIQNYLVSSVVKKLSTMRDKQKEYNGIVLYSPDANICRIIRTNLFQNNLAVDLDDHDLRSYSNWIKIASNEHGYDVKMQELPEHDYGKLFVGLIRLLPRITAKFGTLEKSEYVLDWMKQSQWNIGRGKQPSEYYGVDVNNDIVIKDDELDKDKRYINKHVSSYHARISYDYEEGNFYLQAEERGLGYTRLKCGKDEQTLRTEISIPLHDGDFIKLGSEDHYVLLRFKIG